MRTALILALAAATPTFAQAPATISGAAGATLTSQTASGAVTLSVDPKLQNDRLSIRIVAVNRRDQPQTFGPESIAITAGGRPVAVATAEDLLKRRAEPASRDSALARAAAAPTIPGSGGKDESGATNPANSAAGVPDERFVRAETAPDSDNARRLRGALLASAPVAPRASGSGAILTDRVGRKAKAVDIAVTFAGDVHRFAVTMP